MRLVAYTIALAAAFVGCCVFFASGFVVQELADTLKPRRHGALMMLVSAGVGIAIVAFFFRSIGTSNKAAADLPRRRGFEVLPPVQDKQAKEADSTR
jgi:hypothetical protein